MKLQRLLATSALILWVSNPATALPIVVPFINEIHYDNQGTDRNEFVEIAGSVQSLLGYSLVLYNGGDGRSYRTIPLSIAIPDEGNGFGAVALAVNGLQNGPDGIALVDSLDQVLDWISYEGQLLARNGPAQGMLSQVLPVLQLPATAAGLSLQRIGIGAAAADFGWAGPLANSPGIINAGQRFVVDRLSVDAPNALLLLVTGLLLVCTGRYCNALNCRRRAVSTGSV